MVHYDSENDVMTCDCGNEPADAGFLACDEEGLVVEPTDEDWTSGRLRCMQCGALSDPIATPEPERPPRPLPVVATRQRGQYTVEMVHDQKTFRLRFYASPVFLADLWQAHSEGRALPVPPEASIEIA